jgi:DNA-3-methyladenine glycosylase II
MAARPGSFRLRLPAPLDLPASLALFGRWGDDGLDRWDGRRLARVARLDQGRLAPYVARPGGGLDEPSLAVQALLPAGADANDLLGAITSTFVTELQALVELAGNDAHVRRLFHAHRGLVPVLVPDPFSALVRSITAQQVNLRWAVEVRRRIAQRYGLRHEIGGDSVISLDPAPIAVASVPELRALQLTTAKSVSLIACAQAALSGELRRVDLEALDDEALISRLIQLPGIGRWSAEWFLARTLGRPRVVAGDLGVRKAVGRLYGVEGLPAEAEVRQLTSHWGAAASMAQTLALHDLAGASGGS